MIITPQQYGSLSREIQGDAHQFHAGDEIEISGTRFPVVRRIFNTEGQIEKVLVAKTHVRMSVQNDYLDAFEDAIEAKNSDKLEKIAKDIFAEVGTSLVSLYGFTDSRDSNGAAEES
jgi:hypothetical protein